MPHHSNFLDLYGYCFVGIPFKKNYTKCQIICAATEKAHLPIFSFVLGTKVCLETDDLRVLEISEKCSKLTKHVSY